MAPRYTAEEACAAILNDDLDEMNSADSLDESFSESSSSTSELDSNPEEDYAGRTINVQVPLPTRGRPCASAEQGQEVEQEQEFAQEVEEQEEEGE